MRGWRKKFHANGNLKKALVAVLISYKLDFKIKTVGRDKEEYCIIIKGSIQEEDITILSIHACNIGAPHHIRQILTAFKGEIDTNTITVGGFYTPLTSMDKSSRQKINKETQGLNSTLDQMDLNAIYRAFNSKAAECTFFPSAHGIFSRLDHMLGHKASLS